ncbi:MAG: carbamoyltransferase HypF, partial [Nitrospirae bacterium]
MQRLRINLNGTVQGVGFRPFVFRIANELSLSGFVLNDTTGVIIEVEGKKPSLDLFLKKLHTEKPPLAHIYYEELEYLPPSGYNGFSIKESSSEHPPEAFILPDIATCGECERELLDPSDRRYRYPFINCTNCGPRFTIIKKLPYDRPNTTMSGFIMCRDCKREYNDPLNRRFHAQPNACDLCGPEVFLADRNGRVLSRKESALSDTARLLSDGKIIALKGIGGFHLICNALDEEAVNTLRQRKRRSQKPFAVMFRDLDMIREYAEPTILEESMIMSPARPIVLVKRKTTLLEAASPGLKKIGVFLPYSPLHILILNSIDFPIVATSGNISDEPIVKENDEGLERLKGLTDLFLLHNRPIERRCDDSVVKEVGGAPQIIRRSRGYVPLPIKLPFKLKRPVLAVGGHEKNTISIGFDDRIITSQHIGDMETPESIDNFESIIEDLSSIYRFEPEIVIHDLHPDYITTKWARKRFHDK